MMLSLPLFFINANLHSGSAWQTWACPIGRKPPLGQKFINKRLSSSYDLKTTFSLLKSCFIVHTQHLLPGAGVGLEQNELSNLSLFSTFFMFIMFAISFLVNPLAFLQHNSAPGKDEMSNRKKASGFNIFVFQIESGAKMKV